MTTFPMAWSFRGCAQSVTIFSCRKQYFFDIRLLLHYILNSNKKIYICSTITLVLLLCTKIQIALANIYLPSSYPKTILIIVFVLIPPSDLIISKMASEEPYEWSRQGEDQWSLSNGGIFRLCWNVSPPIWCLFWQPRISTWSSTPEGCP